MPLAVDFQGGIKTMQRYWERATTRAEECAPRARSTGPAVGQRIGC